MRVTRLWVSITQPLFVKSMTLQFESVRTHEPSVIVNLVECWFNSNTGTTIVALAYILFWHRLTVVCTCTRCTQACCGTSLHIISSIVGSIDGCLLYTTLLWCSTIIQMNGLASGSSVECWFNWQWVLSIGSILQNLPSKSRWQLFAAIDIANSIYQRTD